MMPLRWQVSCQDSSSIVGTIHHAVTMALHRQVIESIADRYTTCKSAERPNDRAFQVKFTDQCCKKLASASVTVSGAVFERVAAGRAGGAIHAQRLSVRASVFRACSSSGDGGAISLSIPFSDMLILDATITESVFVGNQATNFGGSLHLDASGITNPKLWSTTYLRACNISSSSSETGGGVYAADMQYLGMEGSRLSENRAQASGGGAHLERINSVFVTKHTVLESNRAYSYGGSFILPLILLS